MFMARSGKSLKYKIWVLKVSIHCEGCKKKVKKILHSVEDVYSVAVDLQQNKVTVTGNVDADVLIERLLKYGKHAELVPCKAPAKNDDKNQQPQPPPLLLKVQQSTSHEKNSDSSLANEGGPSGSPSPPQKKKPPDAKEEAPSQTKDSLEVNANGNNGNTTTKASTQQENQSAGPSGINSTSAAASVAAGETSRGNKQTAESALVVGDDSGKNKNKEVPIQGVPNPPRREEALKSANLAGGDGGSVASPASSNYYPAHPQAHQPIYTTSHRTAQPSSSYPVNYAPPVPYTYAYGYAHPEGTALPRPGYFPGDSTSAFDLFSDENTNSCSLM